LDNRGDAPNEMGSQLPVVELGRGRSVVALSSGNAHNCALLDNGLVKCWGANDRGQLGLGDTNHRGGAPDQMGDGLAAVSLGTVGTVVSLASGDSHNCALFDNGQVKCWGRGASGALGLGDTMNRGEAPGQMGDNLPFVALGMGRSAKAIEAGYNFTCVLLDNAKVKCWGANGHGELGLGDSVNRGDAPGEMGDDLPFVELGAGRSVMAIAAGRMHNCALLEGGQVKCWGYNFSDFGEPWNSGGQLGLPGNNRGMGPNEMGDNLPAVDLGTGRSAVAIWVGWEHSCARLDNGQTKCWGYNRHGDLGLGDTNSRGSMAGQMGDSLPAIDLGTGRSAISVRFGVWSACAVLDNGQAKCWGFNLNGELGQGDKTERGSSPGQMGDNLFPIAF
jgi:alpha-tubulin suppressor-like RCC1 family protein